MKTLCGTRRAGWTISLWPARLVTISVEILRGMSSEKPTVGLMHRGKTHTHTLTHTHMHTHNNTHLLSLLSPAATNYCVVVHNIFI